jgi:hypothetical protein
MAEPSGIRQPKAFIIKKVAPAGVRRTAPAETKKVKLLVFKDIKVKKRKILSVGVTKDGRLEIFAEEDVCQAILETATGKLKATWLENAPRRDEKGGMMAPRP